MFWYSPLFIKVLRHTGIHLLFAHPQSTTKGTPPAAVQSSNTSITSAARAAPSAPPPFAQSKFRVSPSPSMHSRKFFSHTVWCFGFFCVSSTLFFLSALTWSCTSFACWHSITLSRRKAMMFALRYLTATLYSRTKRFRFEKQYHFLTSCHACLAFVCLTPECQRA